MDEKNWEKELRSESVESRIRQHLEDSEENTGATTQRIKLRNLTILFSDIVGITSYFDHFGDLAGMKRISTHNKTLFPVIQAHGGTVIKTIGDAILAIFNSQASGVQAAIDMQRALLAYNRNKRPEDQIHIRIGLNCGRSIVDKNDVFGDAVNVASRVCQKASGDQILISRTVVDALQDHSIRVSLSSIQILKGKEAVFDLHEVNWNADAIPAGTPARTTEPETPRPSVREKDDEVTNDPTKRVEGFHPAPPSPAGTGAKRGLLLSAALALVCITVGVVVLIALRNPPADKGPQPSVNSPGARPGSLDGTAADTSAVASFAEPPLAPKIADGGAGAPGTIVLANSENAGADKQAGQDWSDERKEIIALEAAEKILVTTVARTGLIPGDVPELDAIRGQVKALREQKRTRAAIDAARRAQGIAGRIRIDQDFIDAKLTRFNRLFENPSQKDSTESQDLVLRIMEAIEREDLQAANRLLNTAFGLMQKKKAK